MSLDLFHEGKSIEQPLVFKYKFKLEDKKDENGITRRNVTFTGYLNQEKLPVSLSYGILYFEDVWGLECYEIGIFTKQLRLIGTGIRK